MTVAVARGRCPIVGHLPTMLRPLHAFEALRDQGAVVVVYVFRRPWYVVTAPTLAQEVLARDEDFEPGPQYDVLEALLGAGLSTSSGPAHRARRQLMRPAFTRERVDALVPMMRNTAVETVDGWRPGDVIRPVEQARRLALMIVARSMVSVDVSEDVIARIQQDLPRVLRGVLWRVLCPGSGLPRLPLPGNRRWDAANRRLRRTVDNLIEQRHAHGDSEHDLLALLVGAKLDHNAIRDELVNVLFAGTETTAGVLAWALHVVAARPDLQDRVVDEVRAGEMRSLRNLIRSTMHWYAPPVLSRRTRDTVTLGTASLPAGAAVLLSPVAIHRHGTFDPDHPPSPPGRGGTETVLTFGGGEHACIGRRFAMVELETVISEILRRVRLRPVGRTGERVSGTLVPTRMRLRVESR